MPAVWCVWCVGWAGCPFIFLGSKGYSLCTGGTPKKNGSSLEGVLVPSVPQVHRLNAVASIHRCFPCCCCYGGGIALTLCYAPPPLPLGPALLFSAAVCVCERGRRREGERERRGSEGDTIGTSSVKEKLLKEKNVVKHKRRRGTTGRRTIRLPKYTVKGGLGCSGNGREGVGEGEHTRTTRAHAHNSGKERRNKERGREREKLGEAERERERKRIPFKSTTSHRALSQKKQCRRTTESMEEYRQGKEQQRQRRRTTTTTATTACPKKQQQQREQRREERAITGSSVGGKPSLFLTAAEYGRRCGPASSPSPDRKECFAGRRGVRRGR